MASTREAICSVLRKLFIALVGKYFRSLFCTCSRLKVWFLFKVGEIGQDIIRESFDAGIEILCCTVKDYSFSTYAVFNGGIFSLEIGILLVCFQIWILLHHCHKPAQSSCKLPLCCLETRHILLRHICWIYIYRCCFGTCLYNAC